MIFVMTFVSMIMMTYQQVKQSKLNFLSNQKIIRLFKQQNTIFDHLPDGTIVYKKKPQKSEDGEPEGQEIVHVKYINQTFKSMFQKYLSEAAKTIN